MNKLYFLLFVLCFCGGVNAQIVNIPDTNFKNKLLTLNCADFNNDGIFDDDVDVNNDGEIQESEAQNVLQLNIDYTYISPDDETYLISNLEGINSFVNLKRISFDHISFNNIDVDFSQLSQLEYVKINNSDTDLIKLINLSNLTHLISLDLNSNRPHDFITLPNLSVSVNLNGTTNLSNLNYSNSLLNFNFCQIPNLKNLNCYYLEGGEPSDGVFDFSCLTKLETLIIGENFMEVLIIKNGSLLNQLDASPFMYTKPKFICIDDNPQELQQILNSGLVGPNTVVNSYCSFEPGGQYYTIKGRNKFDRNNDGCDELDIVYPNLKFITNEVNSETIISNVLGEYKTTVQAGNVIVTPIIENPNYFSISPSTVTVSFPSQPSPFTQDFCITPNGRHTDVEVSVIPVEVARPGFDAKYKVVYKNKGNQVENGSLSLNFDDSKMDFVSTSTVPIQSAGVLTWNYNNLQPFETRAIDVVFNINSPMESPAVNGGDILNYTASISTTNTDEQPNDNTFALNQTVVNSFDPNDITCLEGAKVSTAKVGDYVHYMIRFENTGSANAVNIVVKDVVDLTKFDIASLVSLKGSHDYYTRINWDKVEFIFENINLPFDDATNDGYVLFKIKTKSNLVAGDSFSKNANIYFDYNFPITTNTATTTIAALAKQDFEFNSYFKLYPNPVANSLNLESKDTIEVNSIQIYNTLGQLVLVIPNAQNTKIIDVSTLTSGNYFIKVNSDKGTSNTKFLKQ